MFFLKECDSFLEGISELFKVIHEGSFLSSLNGLEIHLMSLLVGPFRITFIDGQKHLKSLLLLPNIVCGGGGDMPCFSRSSKTQRKTPRAHEGGRGRGGGFPSEQAPSDNCGGRSAGDGHRVYSGRDECATYCVAFLNPYDL